MTDGSAERTPAPAVQLDAAAEKRRAWLVALTVGAAFLALFWPILAVRYHFYLETPRYSHCMLLPAVSAMWIYDRWDAIRVLPRSASGRGLAFLVLSLAVFLYGRLLAKNMIQHVGMLGSIVGLVWTLAGAATLRALAFPIGYLALMIPLKPWDEKLTLPLQSLATRIAETFFSALGWVVVREGNVLQLPRLKLLVEEGCSGVHSLFALIALAVAWVFFVERPGWLRATLVVATLPIAVLANAIRVSVTGVLAYKVDPDYARGVSHETAGMIVFAIGVALMLAVDWCLKPDPPVTDEPGRA
jgi:exosortase